MKLGKSLRYLYIQKESQNSSSTLIIIEKLYILKFYNYSVANKGKRKKKRTKIDSTDLVQKEQNCRKTMTPGFVVNKYQLAIIH